jgi:hypothetical protein
MLSMDLHAIPLLDVAADVVYMLAVFLGIGGAGRLATGAARHRRLRAVA